MIEVVSVPAASATVQDLGRLTALKWGVGLSGAMDPMALAVGNILIGNDDNAAGIEIQIFPFQVRFLEPCTFAITGADCDAHLDGLPLPPWWRHLAKAGQVLELGFPRSGVWSASRAYLCVAGGVDVPEVLGSRSTQLRGAFGGFEGRALRTGDRISVGPVRAEVTGDLGVVPPALDMPRVLDGVLAIRVLPAAEYSCYTAESLATFWGTPWRMTPQSNRYGYRLEGTPLIPTHPLELRSHGIVPGVIQVPHGGQPIVQMRDAQPSGGYPKIGTIIEADLWRIGQAPIGSRIRFVQVSWEEAIAAQELNTHWLNEVRRLVGLHAMRVMS